MTSDEPPDRPHTSDADQPAITTDSKHQTWTKHRSKVYRILGTIGGLTVLGFLIWKVGPTEVYSQIRGVGWRLLPVLTISCLWKISNTYAWILTFRPDVRLPSFFTLFFVNVSGDVLNNTLPTNMGGELSKPYLLRAHVAPDDVVSALVANKSMEIASGFIFATFGVVVAVIILPIPTWLRLALLGVMVFGCVVIIAFCAFQRAAPLSRLSSLFNRIRLMQRLNQKLQAGFSRIDANLKLFYSAGRARRYGCIALRFASWGLGTLETVVVLRLIGIDITVLEGLLFVSLPLIVDSIFIFVPGALGTYEAGHTYVAVLLGLAPTLGLSTALIKRLRKIVWMGIGGTALLILLPRATVGEPLSEHTPSTSG